MNSKLGILNKTVVPINLYPKHHSEMADEGLYGMVVKILEDVGEEWYYIETHYDYKGYVHGSNMIMDNTRAAEWMDNADRVIIHGVADVMPEASYKGYVKKMLTRGAIIIATENEKDGWTEIQLSDNSKGWVRTNFIGNRITSYNKNKEMELRENIVKTAMLYLGTQYRWGGKSPLGIDCSGLCSIAYMLNGIIIYRDAIRKDEYMRSITLEEIKSGDLLFFPGHVAMYIGNNKYIHSSAGIDGVKINSLNSRDSDYKEDLAKTITDIGSIF
ncbi:SH3 domain-containing C40 family peptidase [Tissierella sp. MB52-C2]|uniref:C40 family peptidase n=1 Tax=Tissierella sp. MB52-C2 TaxID=3070999 RepID=UPI00280B0DFA|nr:SH3 domain-containing C40 family peptidase [Tissierella sp. MB52-C2]WMM25108.1 SH3 domain-containing C40 family peptidase [Tissierella sp. MB52-C2]